MNTITFDGGVKRQFVLPAAIVLGAHAALFLGFMSRPVALPIHINPPHVHETESKPIEVPLIDETTAQKGDDRSHDSSTQPQLPDIPNPISQKEPNMPGIPITPELPGAPVVFPGPWSPPSGIGDEIGHDKQPFSPDMLDHTPEAVRQSQPIYPINAKNTGENGEVVVTFVVDESGRVLNPQVVSSTDPIFEEPTIHAIGQWRFVPGTMHGVPVRFRMRV
ncbi:MAG TPA: energy transducer TonB, partial [Opitutaceae bacterium]|nr:energy transducer TonB [Opitutaceae bacterium]